jgi:catechol 2,3-dioxygenase-like lactoylglutathione lyase family enzyme
MIDHVTISVGDLEKSKRFYEEVFAPLGYKVAFGEEGVFWAFDIGQGLFEICQDDDRPLTSVHVAFRVESRQRVREFHEAALKAGAKDHGAPGPRPHYTENYYACFILDPDEHNIEVMHDAPKE